MSSFFNRSSKKNIVIDCSLGMITAISVESSRKKVFLKNYDYLYLSGNSDLDEILSFLRLFLGKDSHHFRRTIISLNSCDAIEIKRLNLPFLSNDDVMNAVKFEIADSLSFGVDEALLDWKPMENLPVKEGSSLRPVIVFAGKKEVINFYADVLRRCHLVPDRVTNILFNYETILRAQQEQSRDVVAVLNIGFKETVLGIYYNNALVFSRVLPISKEKMINALTEPLVGREDEIVFSYKEAQNIISQFGLSMLYEGVMSNAVYLQHIRKLLVPHLESIVKQLDLSFNYFIMNNDYDYPSGLYLSGFGANIKNFDVYLKHKLELKVSNLQLPSSVDFSRLEKQEISEQDKNILTSALGAVIDGSKGLNLIKSEIRAQKVSRFERLKFYFLILFGAFFIFLAFIMFEMKIQMDDYKLAYFQKYSQEVRNVEALARQVSLYGKITAHADKGSGRYPKILEGISQLMPENLSLQMIRIDHDGSFELKGEVFSQGNKPQILVSDWVEQLEGTGLFADVNAVDLKTTLKTKQFFISGRIK